MQRDPGDQQRVADRVREQRANERGIEHKHQRDNDWRHTHQERHRQTSLSGINANLALNLEALADDVREVIEDFGEVAASFALQHHGRDKELHVDQGHALGEIDEGIANRHAEFLLFVELAELARDRFGYLVGNHFEGGSKRVPGANGSGQCVDGFRKKFLELLEALIPTVRNVGVGKYEAYQHRHPCDFDPLAESISDERGDNSSQGGYSEKISGAQRHSSLRQHLLDIGDPCRPAQQLIDRRNLAELLVAQKREFFFSGEFGCFALVGQALFDKTGARVALVEDGADGKRRQRDHDEDQ